MAAHNPDLFGQEEGRDTVNTSRGSPSGLSLFAFRHLPGHLSLSLDASLVVSFSCSEGLVLCLFPQLSAQWPSPPPCFGLMRDQPVEWEGRAEALCPRSHSRKRLYQEALFSFLRCLAKTWGIRLVSTWDPIPQLPASAGPHLFTALS